LGTRWLQWTALEASCQPAGCSAPRLVAGRPLRPLLLTHPPPPPPIPCRLCAGRLPPLPGRVQDRRGPQGGRRAHLARVQGRAGAGWGGGRVGGRPKRAEVAAAGCVQTGGTGISRWQGGEASWRGGERAVTGAFAHPTGGVFLHAEQRRVGQDLAARPPCAAAAAAWATQAAIAPVRVRWQKNP
jgi:hypothetical protein